MCSKKTLLITSGVATGILVILNLVGTFKLCGGQQYGQCMDTAYGLIIAFLPILPLFLFSIITYKMRDEVYRAWLRFAQWWIPLSIVLIFIAPEYANEFLYQIASKGGAAFITSVLFVIISLLIIIWKYLSPGSKYKNDFKEGSRM